MRDTIQGEIVHEFREFGHHFQIEKLPTPRIVGAGPRTHRLWENGQPASGGQWHYNFESAMQRARYCLECEYSRRVAFLELAVNNLQRQLHECRTAKPRFRIAAGRRVAA